MTTTFLFSLTIIFFTGKILSTLKLKLKLDKFLLKQLLKKLDVQQFMKPFEKVSNLKQTTVKRILIESIEQEIQNKFLQPKFQILQKDNSVKYFNQIKPINITRAKFIYFYENINIRDLLKQI
jgi:hypothetical protein